MNGPASTSIDGAPARSPNCPTAKALVSAQRASRAQALFAQLGEQAANPYSVGIAVYQRVQAELGRELSLSDICSKTESEMRGFYRAVMRDIGESKGIELSNDDIECMLEVHNHCGC